MRGVGGGADGSAWGGEERGIEQGGWGRVARSSGAVDGRAASEDFVATVGARGAAER